MEMDSLYEVKEYSFNKFMTSTFGYMTLGLIITSITCLFGVELFYPIINTFSGVIFLFIAQIGIAIYFSHSLFKMSHGTALSCFMIYSFLTGVSLSYLPIVYGGGTLFIAVAMTSVVFISMLVIGHTTRMDLSKLRPYLYGGLTALILTTVLNVFLFRSFGLDAILNYAGIIIFLGLIAYDMQNLRNIYAQGQIGQNMGAKLAIYGAFELYLDFINLFIRVLEIVGNRSDD